MSPASIPEDCKIRIKARPCRFGCYCESLHIQSDKSMQRTRNNAPVPIRWESRAQQEPSQAELRQPREKGVNWGITDPWPLLKMESENPPSSMSPYHLPHFTSLVVYTRGCQDGGCVCFVSHSV